MINRRQKVKNISAIIILAILTGCVFKNKNNNPRKKALKSLTIYVSNINDSGKEVHKYVDERIDYDLKGHIASHLWYRNSACLDMANYYTYDSAGREVQDIFIVDNAVDDVTEIKYNRWDSVSEYINHNTGLNGGTSSTTYMFYDSNRNHIEDSAVFSNGELYYIDRFYFNKAGKCVKNIRTGRDGQNQYTVLYYYDSHNRETKEWSTGNMNGDWETRYDNLGRDTEEVAISSLNHDFWWLYTFAYDNSNRKKTKIQYNKYEDRPKHPYKIWHYVYEDR